MRSFHLALAFLSAPVAVLATSSHALAQETTSSPSGALHSYYGGERASAYFIASFSALSVGAGAALAAQDTDFARGLGWPLIALGAIEGIGAIVYAFQVGAEIRHYQGSLERDGAAYRREELAHMHGTSSRFVFYRLMELGLTLGGVGAATYGFVANVDTWKGIGIGVTAVALPLLLIDTINDARATRYTEQVRGFEPRQQPPPSDARAQNGPVLPSMLAGSPLFVAWGGRF